MAAFERGDEAQWYDRGQNVASRRSPTRRSPTRRSPTRSSPSRRSPAKGRQRREGSGNAGGRSPTANRAGVKISKAQLSKLAEPKVRFEGPNDASTAQELYPQKPKAKARKRRATRRRGQQPEVFDRLQAWGQLRAEEQRLERVRKRDLAKPFWHC